MRRLLLFALCLLCPLVAVAQERPTAVSTLQTTDTSTGSVKVGCAIGSSTCTGGIMAGPISAVSVALSGGYLEIQSFVPVSQSNRLVNNSGTLQWNGAALATGASLSGTTGSLAVFTGASSVGNAICSQSGTTLTCANTVSATTLTGTLSTAAQPNITTLAGLTTANALTSATSLASVGTITTGTWTATKIGLLYGGTNADLTGTGGTSQFLRQNSLGGAITVVRPAVADLSDGSNVIVSTGSYADPSWLTSLNPSKLTAGTDSNAITLSSTSNSIAAATLKFSTAPATTNTSVAGNLNTANFPGGTASNFGWVAVLLNDGSTAYIPVWK